MNLIWMRFSILLNCPYFISAYRCDASQFGNLVKGKRLGNDILESINPGGLALCARECLYRKQCQSFNYVDSSDNCELIGAVQTGNLVTVAGTYYSEKSTWPTNIAGSCRAHECSEFQKCVQYSNTVSDCIDIYQTILQADNTEIKKGIFESISGVSRNDCVKECLYRSQCLSFNHSPANNCELSTVVMVTDMNHYSGNSLNIFYSAVSQYDVNVAGYCSSRPCLNSEVCQETSSSYTCNRNWTFRFNCTLLSQIYCLKPTNISFENVVALFDKDTELWPLTTNLTYRCEDGYYPEPMWNCKLDGTWTTPSCVAVKRCSDIYNSAKCDTPNRVNSLYILKYPDTDQDIILYCMVNDPLNWLNLNNFGNTYTYFSANISKPECQISDKCGRSIFSIIRGVANPVMEYIFTRLHVTEECETKSGPYPGTAGKNCSDTCNIEGENGGFQFDIRGTGMKFIRQITTFDYGTLQYSHGDQVVTAVCDDCAETCKLSERRTIVATGTYVNYTGAAWPVCKTL